MLIELCSLPISAQEMRHMIRLVAQYVQWPHIFQVFAKGMSDLANWQTKSLIYSVPADSCLPRGWMDTRTFRGRNDGRAI